MYYLFVVDSVAVNFMAEKSDFCEGSTLKENPALAAVDCFKPVWKFHIRSYLQYSAEHKVIICFIAQSKSQSLTEYTARG